MVHVNARKCLCAMCACVPLVSEARAPAPPGAHVSVEHFLHYMYSICDETNYSYNLPDLACAVLPLTFQDDAERQAMLQLGLPVSFRSAPKRKAVTAQHRQDRNKHHRTDSPTEVCACMCHLN